MKTNWIYYGLFLPDEERAKLLDYLYNSDWDYMFEEISKVYLDHCTLLHIVQCKMDEEKASSIENCLKWLLEEESTYKLIITHIGYNDKAIAFKVKHENPEFLKSVCFNKNPHITIGTYDTGKPVHSNTITNWYEIEPIEITTYLKRV